MAAFHSSSGGYDFLGLRSGRHGGVEIVYDDGDRRRMVWRVQSGEEGIDDALRAAVDQARVLPALFAELRKRGVVVEAV